MSVSQDRTPPFVYSPASRVRQPRVLLKEMWGDLGRSRELAWRLTVRDISTQYRQAYFGIMWAFLPPIVAGLLFIFLNNQKLLRVQETNVSYPVFVMIGTTLWQTFADSLNAPSASFSAAKSMLAQLRFAREAIILAAFGRVLFNLGIRILIIVAVLVIFQVSVTWWLLLSPVAILMLIVLGISLGLLLVPLGLLYTDISRAIALATGLWFFLTPVVYPIPKTWPLSLLGVLNPVSPILGAARDLIASGTIENVVPLLVVSFLAIFALLLGWVFVRLALPIVVERMGA